MFVKVEWVIFCFELFMLIEILGVCLLVGDDIGVVILIDVGDVNLCIFGSELIGVMSLD